MSPGAVRFGPFELDPANYQLKQHRRTVKLERIPMELLLLLAGKAGQLVTRDEIVAGIWGKGVFLDVDNAVNSAIRKIRRALGENPERPRYLETVPGKGYRFVASVKGLGGRAAEPVAEAAAPLERAMLAVLPLDNLSGDPEQDYFVDGMTEELTTQLSRLHGHLGIIARTSAMAYKHTKKRISDIGRELGVGHVVEGSIRRHAGRVRISVQLIEVSDETHLWAENYDGAPGDVLKLQEQVAIAIAGQIGRRLSAAGIAPALRAQAVNPAAHEAYLLGRHFWNQKTEQAVEKSLERFQAAVDLDPDFALAYAGLADAHILLGIHGYRAPSEVYPKAGAAAIRALELDDTLAEAHTSLADVRKNYDWDWAAAEGGFRRALDLNANYVVAHHWYADYLAKQGRHREAINQIAEARRLDPFSNSINAFVCYTFYRARQFDRAVEEGRRAIELHPDAPLGHWFLGLAYEALGELPKAVAQLEQAARLSGERPLYLAALGHAFGTAGRRPDARGVIERLIASSAKRYVSPLDVAMVYTGLGEVDEAFTWLEKAYQERATRIEELPEPAFDGLRSDPRLGDLLRRIGLPA